jgi:hypothetical protein
MAVRDPQTEWMRVQLYRKMTPQQRFWIGAQIYEEGVAIVRSSIRYRHPNISSEELEREVRRRLLPRETFEQIETVLQEQKRRGAI